MVLVDYSKAIIPPSPPTNVAKTAAEEVSLGIVVETVSDNNG
jgi:hypothetical protein